MFEAMLEVIAWAFFICLGSLIILKITSLIAYLYDSYKINKVTTAWRKNPKVGDVIYFKSFMGLVKNEVTKVIKTTDKETGKTTIKVGLSNRKFSSRSYGYHVSPVEHCIKKAVDNA